MALFEFSLIQKTHLRERTRNVGYIDWHFDELNHDGAACVNCNFDYLVLDYFGEFDLNLVLYLKMALKWCSIEMSNSKLHQMPSVIVLVENWMSTFSVKI